MVRYVSLLFIMCVPFFVGAQTIRQEKVLTMTDAERAGAVIMPSFEKNITAKRFGIMLCDIHARSYIILRKDTSRALVDEVQRAYRTACGASVPQLVVALDAEPSLMPYRMPEVQVPLTKNLTASSTIVATAETIARALKRAGIAIDFAPVYDVNMNATIIGDRSFGKEVTTVALRANLFSTTLMNEGVIPTAKHFPGHGLAGGDTHKTRESIPGTLKELPAFSAAISAGIPVIMVGHMSVKGGAWDTGGVPATLSKKIMTDLLKTTLGFTGVVVTDSMAMGALNGEKDRSVRALSAGADLVLIPVDPRAAYARVLAKMQEDRVFRARVIEASDKVMNLFSIHAQN